MDNNDLINKDNNYIPKHSAYYLKNNSKHEEKTTINISEKNYNNEIESVNKKRRYRRRYNKKRIIRALLLLLVFIFLCCLLVYSLVKIINWNFDNRKTKDVTKKIEEILEVIEVEDTDNTVLVNEEEDKDNAYWYYVSFPLINVDINSLYEKNSDTVGFINVNNTNVNYPFVQYKDNDYYLNHSFDKSYNEAGWLFLDYRNDSNLNNRNSIIYGHSRLDKTMFGSLSKVLKSSWYSNKDNHIIRISSRSENTMWQIFSVYKIKTESYYITTDFNSDDEYMEFLDTIKKRSLYDFNTNLGKDDKILTLSTCYSDTERTVVHAKLIKKSVK